MHTILRTAAAAAAAALMGTAAQAQTPAQEPGNDSSPSTMSTHRPGETRPQDTVQEATSPTSAATTPAAPSAAPADNTPHTRSEVRDEAAAMNREDALPRGELSLPARSEAPDGSFQRKF